MKKSKSNCKAVNQNGGIYNIQNCKGGGTPSLKGAPHSRTNSIQNSKGSINGGASKYYV